MLDYKKTLNLPKTNFSMKANLTLLEPKILEFWDKIDLYKLSRRPHLGKKFILHDGPPYANGPIHIGHALNKILKDIVLKYKILSGFDCPFIVGWDCHGLPVEHQLFKELNLTKHEVDVIDFREKAKEFSLKFVKIQSDDFKRLGVFSDWQNPYLTLDKDYEYRVIKLLENLVAGGYIYRERMPVNWCWKCETALAEAEVEYNEHKSDSIYVKFKAINLTNKQDTKDVYFIIWTTTPWTLLGNIAVALHPQESYVALKRKDDQVWIVAEKLVEKFLAQVNENLEDFKIIWKAIGSQLENSTYKHPFIDRVGRVVLADYVSMEEGTGCVHTASGHGLEDYLTGKKYNLEMIMPVDDKGRFDYTVGEFSGLFVFDANTKIIEKLKKDGLLVWSGSLLHQYPHCWRCKSPIIFRATFQWFLNVEHNNLRKRLLEEIERVDWIPSSGKERIKAMIIQRPDWCLSRQRLWGVPIPALKCNGCKEVILDKDVIAKTAKVFKKEGSLSWFKLPVDEFLPENFVCKKCGSKDFSKEYDILDVWFESGASFFAVLMNNDQLSFPADMYLEGSDQHRGWFQVSLIPSVAIFNTAPFKKVLTHGFVVDIEGKKMSKSLGNVISPQEIVKKYGAEILRLWVAYSDYGEDIKISEDIISQLVDIYRKIRNTIRFILGNLYDFKIDQFNLDYRQLCEVDRYMLNKTFSFYKEMISNYEDFCFYKVCQGIFNFCNLDLSSFYLDILKDRLYTFSPNSSKRRSAQFVLYNILDILLKLIAPILPFTAEEAYSLWDSFYNRKESIFLENLLDLEKIQIDFELLNRWEKILSLRDQVLVELEKVRQKNIIGSSLEAKVCINLEESEYKFFKGLEELLKEIFIVSKVIIKEGDFKIEVEHADGRKCQRCWNWGEDVKEEGEFAFLCSRCINALKEANYEKV